MMLARVTDLDELALTVRDQTSKSYILEAINAYRGGALRSSIMSTWIAVSYDIISKLRELANQGDNQAAQWVNTLDNAIRNVQVARLQTIEEELLDKAHNNFELLAPHEYEDLLRLKKDRNLCAHPAFVAEEVLFQPTPDLARTHIVHSILHLLRHQPVQGRSALTRINVDMLQPSFPDDVENISRFMNSKYLDRARDTLVQGLVDSLMKTFLRANDPGFAGKETILINTLKAISMRHPAIYEQRMATKLAEVVDGLDDQRILSVFLLVKLDQRSWNWISEAAKIRITRIVRSVNTKELSNLSNNFRIFDLMDIESIKPMLLGIFNDLETTAQQNVISKNPRPEFARKAVQLYEEAGSFRGAESLGQSIILPMLPYFSADDVVSIVNVARDNWQIWQAEGTKDVLVRLFDQTTSFFDKTGNAWKDFVENALKHEDPDAYYGYPELQARLKARGIEPVAKKVKYYHEAEDEHE